VHESLLRLASRKILIPVVCGLHWIVRQDALLYFWDLLLLESEDDPLLHYFVSLTLLSSQR
jgi:hypothetical protein